MFSSAQRSARDSPNSMGSGMCIISCPRKSTAHWQRSDSSCLPDQRCTRRLDKISCLAQMSYQVLLHGCRRIGDGTHVAVPLADGAWKLRMRLVVLLLKVVAVPHHQMARAVASRAALSNVTHHVSRSQRRSRKVCRSSKRSWSRAYRWLSRMLERSMQHRTPAPAGNTDAARS